MTLTDAEWQIVKRFLGKFKGTLASYLSERTRQDKSSKYALRLPEEDRNTLWQKVYNQPWSD